MEKNYGDILNFKEADSFELPDFIIIFLGETKVEKDNYVNKYFVYYDYEIKNGADSIVVSWSPGTGFVSPGNFEFGGKKWVLDNQSSDGIKILPFEQFEGHTVELPTNRSYK